MSESRHSVLGAIAQADSRRYGVGRVYFIVYFMFFFSQADNYLARIGILPVRPVVLFILLSMPLVAVAVAGENGPRQGSAAEPARGSLGKAMHTLYGTAVGDQPLIGPAALAYCGILLISASYPGANWTQHGKYVLLPIYSLGVLAVGLWLGRLPFVRRALRRGIVLAFVALAASVVVDLVLPGTFTKHAARPTGLPQDPNVSCFLIVCLCGLLIDYREPRPRDFGFLLATALLTVVTMSRGGLGLLIFLLLLLVIYPIERSNRVRRIGLAIFGTVAVVGALLLTSALSDHGIGTFGRYSAQRRIDRLTSGRILGSEERRVELAGQAIEAIGSAPLLGHGAGSALLRKKGPHNYYLLVWENQGILGLLAYVALLAGAFLHFNRRSDVAGVITVALVAGESMLSHNVLELRGIPLILGLLASREGAGSSADLNGGDPVPAQ